MTRKLCPVLAVLFVLSSTLALAAEAKPAEKAPAAKPAEEPEYVGIPSRVNPKTGELQSLERQVYQLQSKVKGLGFGGAHASYDVAGKASPNRFPATEVQKFVIKLAGKEADPSAVLKLVPLTPAAASKKAAKEGAPGVRQIAFVDQKGMFQQATVDPTHGALPLLIKSFGESSLEIKPETQLAPGEYAILLPASSTAFCFGLD